MGWFIRGLASLISEPIVTASAVCIMACEAATVGCSMSLSHTHQTAFVSPPALPVRTGRPLEKGELQLQAEINPLRLLPASKTFGNDASLSMYVPMLQLGGSLYASAGAVEFGLHVQGARLRWADGSPNGGPDFPDNNKSVVTFGQGLRINTPKLPAPIGLSISFGMESNFEFVPVQRETVSRELWPFEGETTRTTDSYDELMWTASVYLLVDKGFFADRLHIHALMALRREPVNRAGWSWPYEDSHLDQSWSISPGFGVEWNHGWYFLSATLYYPIVFEDADRFGPCMAVRTGFNFPLFQDDPLSSASLSPSPHEKASGRPLPPSCPNSCIGFVSAAERHGIETVLRDDLVKACLKRCSEDSAFRKCIESKATDDVVDSCGGL